MLLSPVQLFLLLTIVSSGLLALADVREDELEDEDFGRDVDDLLDTDPSEGTFRPSRRRNNHDTAIHVNREIKPPHLRELYECLMDLADKKRELSKDDLLKCCTNRSSSLVRVCRERGDEFLPRKLSSPRPNMCGELPDPADLKTSRKPRLKGRTTRRSKAASSTSAKPSTGTSTKPPTKISSSASPTSPPTASSQGLKPTEKA